jgi:hypothetical protein
MGRLTILMKSNSESSKLTPRGPQLVLPTKHFPIEMKGANGLARRLAARAGQ